MNLEGHWSTLEGTWRVAENGLNLLQLKKKDNYLVAEPGEQAPGREGGARGQTTTGAARL
jgi:hypothetical protein